jgi:type II secretory pathway pseudopilin PulG
METMNTVVIVGLLAALAVPVFCKARRASKGTAIYNILRLFASASEQCFLGNGTFSVNLSQLVGVSRYLKSPVKSVAEKV